MDNLPDKILNLQILLNTCDLYAKGHVCDQFLEIIRTTPNEDLKAELCKMVMQHLVDLDREKDLIFCQKILMSHYDYHSHLAVLWSQASWCRRRTNLHGQLEAFNTGIEIAKCQNDDIALSEGLLNRGKVWMAMGDLDNALDDFSRTIPVAEKTNNYKLVAIAHYYTALILKAKGHPELCLQKLREASEIAMRQHSQTIVMQTEVLRAKVQMELGRTDVAKKILDDWCKEFGLML